MTLPSVHRVVAQIGSDFGEINNIDATLEIIEDNGTMEIIHPVANSYQLLEYCRPLATNTGEILLSAAAQSAVTFFRSCRRAHSVNNRMPQLAFQIDTEIKMLCEI